jgi:hypothetical protein
VGVPKTPVVDRSQSVESEGTVNTLFCVPETLDFGCSGYFSRARSFFFLASSGGMRPVWASHRFNFFHLEAMDCRLLPDFDRHQSIVADNFAATPVGALQPFQPDRRSFT